MSFPSVSTAEWRALVDQELKGAPFEKALVTQVLEGVALQPLYTERPSGALWREVAPAPFRICMRGGDAAAMKEDVAGGADALWCSLDEVPAGVKTFFVLEPGSLALAKLPAKDFALALDALSVPPAQLADVVKKVSGPSVVVSTVRYHDAGADPADELACALATGAACLRSLEGVSVEQAAKAMWLRVPVGRETFVELCKLRALRTCWAKLLAAAGLASPPRVLVHAVCSSRTMSERDPWVNMLRVTTQTFAAVLGGADLVTPLAFDEALGPASALGRRVARNTGLVLRDESGLGQVGDAAGGSYAFETLTDALAREGWKRFQALESDGGMVRALESGKLAERFSAAAKARAEQVSKRKVPVLGVGDFANLDEVLPRAPSGAAAEGPGFPLRRDAAGFEALRSTADVVKPGEVVLRTLGSFAESRPRAGFASGFFSAGGLRTREAAEDVKAAVVCLCGTDEQYAAEGAQRARALKALGVKRVLLAGRPGALEGALREAGVDGFIFVGCDVIATLAPLLEVRS